MRQWTWTSLQSVGSLPVLLTVLNRRMKELENALATLRSEFQGVTTLAAGDTTPSVAGAAVLVTANTSATTVTGFDDGEAGRRIVLVFGDGNTTLDHGSNLQLENDTDITGTAGDVLRFVTDDGTVWRQLPQVA